MQHLPNYLKRFFLGIAAAFFFLGVSLAGAQTLVLNDGRRLEGKHAELASIADNPLSPKATAGEVPLTPIIVVDDGLRRTFFHHFRIKQLLDEKTGRDVRINITQPVVEHGVFVGRVGAATKVTPFDEFGRRIYHMQTSNGPLSVVQGITLITPTYTQIQGISDGARPITWDMRVATSSIPRDVLSKVLSKAIKHEDIEGRLQLVRLYVASERYRDAGIELEQIVKDFPQRQDLQDDVKQLRQLGAKLIIREIQLRAKAGQHQLARKLLAQFPADGVSGETLQQVRELLDKYAAEDARRNKVIEELKAHVAKISDDNNRNLAEAFVKEIAADVNDDAIARLGSFERLVDDAALKPDQKAALAISGWLVGSNQATDNFQTAVSLAHVRDKIIAYLREPLAQNRAKMASEVHDVEGATIDRVAQMLKLMKPPLEVTKQSERAPRMHELTVTGRSGEADLRYVVQLPPEYDPLRHYPTIVALANSDVKPEQMVDFWAGPLPQDNGGDRLGQATRHGYIVIAVDWQQLHQFVYEYTAREHNAVLGALRDANRRFSIDTNRVFLTGHGIGGDAAWDIAIAHPDLWAGVMPFTAVADKYVNRYAKNAPYIAWYFVDGELDGDKIARNAVELDRYLKSNNDELKTISDITFVEFQGRGFETFGDEIQRLFDWMARKQRVFPKQIECVSLRPWDNFFWWLEAEGLPQKSMVVPGNWPPATNVRPARIEGRRLATNKVTVNTQADRVTVWLSPELVDFSQPLVVEVNGRAISPKDRTVRPDVNVLLEDARARADRQQPFWAKLSTP